MASTAQILANGPESGIGTAFQAASNVSRLNQKVTKRILPLPPLRVGVARDGEELFFPVSIRAASLFVRFGCGGAVSVVRQVGAGSGPFQDALDRGIGAAGGSDGNASSGEANPVRGPENGVDELGTGDRRTVVDRVWLSGSRTGRRAIG